MRCVVNALFAANWTKATHCVFVYPAKKGKCKLLGTETEYILGCFVFYEFA